MRMCEDTIIIINRQPLGDIKGYQMFIVSIIYNYVCFKFDLICQVHIYLTEYIVFTHFECYMIMTHPNDSYVRGYF